ncbi:hypothetical protein QBC42DRAFT_265861 [Cladorrhinum samala]|uniref:Essential protein Yae1 N-terminal domain-containing protein n=1 Tax=Cladorrhinum samala TaxID=585594 RepID=A0AAV9HUD8_9PEZI|nr:hypothetical protein QBC42DRAFT_265861 [Cladorrhinum samala]
MSPPTEEDPFDSLLSLEETYYNQGYAEGSADGASAGKAEGRQLGLEKGYQKFFESGRLYGRAILWANRLQSSMAASASASASSPPSCSSLKTTTTTIKDSPQLQDSESNGAAAASTGEGVGGGRRKHLPPLPNNARLEKHITTLYALVETESLSIENTDEAVNDFDDRLKRAQGKAKIIERMVGEKVGDEGSAGGTNGAGKELTV